MRPIETRYACSGDVRIAYQVVGQGSFDLVFVPGFISNLDLHWEDEGYTRLLKRLSAFSRLILFDKRGTGLSDRVDAHNLPSLETRMDDVRAVMDAAGSGRAALLGSSEGAPMAMLFAATYPERTRALALYGGYAHFHKWVMSPERLDAFIEMAETAWGTGATLPHFAPSRVDDAHFAQWWARFERLSASPTAAAALARMNADVDIRHILSVISAPTLVIHRRNDARVDPDASRFLAQKIPGARLVEIPGRDHPIWTGDVDGVADLIEEFLTGERAVGEVDRVLAALLVTRIYDTARLGDRMWSERSQRFQETWRLLVGRHGGRSAGLHGELMISRFDGPARAIRCAAALREAAQEIGVASAQGAHVGEIEVRGPPVGTTARVAIQLAAHAGRGDIIASRLIADLAAGSGLHFTDAGRISVDELEQPLALVHATSEQHLEPACRPKPKTAEPAALTARESEVVSLVADGKSNAAIAAELRLSEHTVKRHVANILLKLDLPSRAAAAAFSARHPGPHGP
ncbi:alpha/beta fold hydrolase [Mesorhizobium sp. M7A.F.Ca.US.005.03.1.1]|uniref:alpha/beta fold hydrolase n=4 Tax=Mesorhizobium TaxID=68287 RepID=UPI000FCBC1E9|nr:MULTISPECIES: alpha/beta fold hydrolase [unclassified Mesorhizobium]RUX76005.1 alpha/beta fold hydrolase [Mesorhizobium sp. M7A.F.Ca.US.005.03.1.1]RUY17807.1 alpha/beta fold hydrolase [Mesorhizobium sp. M7A.F.Ca.US.005.03.2.1]RUY29320.1 alpha/beta fold hydrolase [Mesorhizobium sp. M7A.F.Ca.US.001.04.2.1]RVA14527.1 alpha/beta fold hydrolase [Mesorhizobium sp. M7A.F.Ca.US.002.01.1.1]